MKTASIIKPMPRGGKRPGAGRPPLDPSGHSRRSRKFFVTDDEYSKLKDALEYIRQQSLLDPSDVELYASQRRRGRPKKKP